MYLPDIGWGFAPCRSANAAGARQLSGDMTSSAASKERDQYCACRVLFFLPIRREAAKPFALATVWGGPARL